MAVGHLSLFLCFQYHVPTILMLAAMLLTSASFTLITEWILGDSIGDISQSRSRQGHVAGDHRHVRGVLFYT